MKEHFEVGDNRRVIPHVPRRIAEQLIEGDVVEDELGDRGTILVACDPNGDFHIDWDRDGTAVASPEGIARLRLVERPAVRPGETEPDESVAEPRSHSWDGIDVDEDDRTMWVRYSKNLYQRLQHVDVRETGESIEIELYVARLTEIDPPYRGYLRYGPVDIVYECTRFELDAPLAGRVCLEVLHGGR